MCYIKLIRRSNQLEASVADHSLIFSDPIIVSEKQYSDLECVATATSLRTPVFGCGFYDENCNMVYTKTYHLTKTEGNLVKKILQRELFF